jgi:hypothetical protein
MALSTRCADAFRDDGGDLVFRQGARPLARAIHQGAQLVIREIVEHRYP